MLHLKFKGLVSTEGFPAFNAYGFDVHQPLRAIYCLVNLEAITFLLLYQLSHKMVLLYSFFLCVSSQSYNYLSEVSLTLGISSVPMWNIFF